MLSLEYGVSYSVRCGSLITPFQLIGSYFTDDKNRQYRKPVSENDEESSEQKFKQAYREQVVALCRVCIVCYDARPERTSQFHSACIYECYPDQRNKWRC